MNKLTFILALIMASAMACGPGGSGQGIELGRVPTGATVSFIPDDSGKWGLEIAGGQAATFRQTYPVQIELYRSETEIEKLAAGYDVVKKSGGTVTGEASIDIEGNAGFLVTDRWALDGDVLTLDRMVSVTGNLDNEAGFCSEISLFSTPGLTWPDVQFLAPSLLYGDCSRNGWGPANPTNNRARRFSFREDWLPAPYVSVSMKNGDSMTLLDLEPKGNSVTEEGTIDERFGFGAFEIEETEAGGIDMSYRFPGTTASLRRPPRDRSFSFYFYNPADHEDPCQPGAPEDVEWTWNRRYHPVKEGFEQNYRMGFRFAVRESFTDLIRNTYRWAWQELDPEVNWHDIEIVRKSLADQLSSQVFTIEGRTGLPFIVSTVTGEVWTRENDPDFYWRAVMGFVGKNVEAADLLLCESERDTTDRGRKMRQQALDVFSTFVREVQMSPPIATGFNLKNGTPDMTNKPQWFIREAAEDMRAMMDAYEREKNAGREHPEWIKWCMEFADWCLTQQRPDGSFPRSYMLGNQDVAQPSGATSYNVAPLFPQLTKHLGDEKYLNAAIRAADYVWENYGSRGNFVGGAVDNPNITDKEAGMLSLEAFLSVYEATNDPVWLDRACVAGEYTETWMWIWNCPMPEDGDNETLHWKKGVPTIGGQGITAQTAGAIDQFMDYSVPAYVKLYKYTGDEHYLDVARILLHNTKAMVALPGRLYGMLAPGWQQEHWSLGSSRRRGYGQPEKWMPWVTTNHLFGIYGAEDFDPGIFEALCTRPE